MRENYLFKKNLLSQVKIIQNDFTKKIIIN